MVPTLQLVKLVWLATGKGGHPLTVLKIVQCERDSGYFARIIVWESGVAAVTAVGKNNCFVDVWF